MECVFPVEVLRSGKRAIAMVMVLGASGDAAEIAPEQSVDNCVHEVHQGLVERIFWRGRIDALMEILLDTFLEITVPGYCFDSRSPQCLPVSGDVEDSFNEDLEINENTGTEIFTKVVIVIVAGA